MRYPELFQPIEIGRVAIRNRIAMAPMSTQYANPDGSVTSRMIRYYEERARGGTGLIIVEFAYIDEQGSKAEWNQLGCQADTHIPGLAELAERIHLHGAVSCLQIAHGGSQKLHNMPPFLAPSAIPWTDDSPLPRELTIPEIERIMDDFAEAARRAKQAGFRMVELHGAHGYLITEFLSTQYNQRTDKYGGSLNNRQRFLLELVARVKARVGVDYPVGVRLSAEDYSGGYSLEDTLLLCQRLEEAGIAYIHVSSGNYASRETRITPTYFYPLGNYVPLAARIKQCVHVPAIASGSIMDPDIAADAIRSGGADMVAMARQLFADPHWANKVKHGQLEEIVRCIRCNEGCLMRGIHAKATRCWVNPATGNEAEFELRPASGRRRVMVIGGGPAGMEAARVAVMRGHIVALFDEGEQLGGQLIPASTPWFKQDLVPLNRYLSRQLSKHGVDVHLGTRVDAALVREFDPEVVFLATGAKPVWPAVKRSKSTPQLVNALDVMTGKVKTGRRAIVVGGGLIGAETAWFLAEKGIEVTITTRQDRIGYNLPETARIVLFQGYRRNNVTVVLNVNLDEITETGGVFMNRRWERQHLEADTLVLASGMTPQINGLIDDPALLDKEVHVLGDARAPQDIGTAIFDGAYHARMI